MMSRSREYASLIYAWMRRHKIFTALAVLSAVIMVAGRFASAGGASAPQASGVDTAALRSTVYGFVEEYGSWSWMDPFDTGRLAAFAHPDLVSGVLEERASAYTSGAESADPAAAQALAAQRMQQAGVVKVASIESVDVLAESEDAFQIELCVSEYCFTNQQGLVRQDAVYSMDIERAKGAGMAAPYLVVRFIRN